MQQKHIVVKNVHLTKLQVISNKIQAMNKSLNYMLAIAATSTIILSSCNNKNKATDNPTTDTDLDNIIAENSVTVKHNATNDTTLLIGGEHMRFTEISRIFNVGYNNQFYMSVRAIVPEVSGSITNSLYNTIVEYYNALGDTINVAPETASTPAQLAGAIDAMGKEFVQYVTPMANDTITPGFMMNTDIRPVYGNQKYITYAIYDDYYTGGAHGEVDTYFTTFDAATGNQYTFDTMFTPQGQAKIRERIVDIIAKDKEQSVEEYLKSLNEFLFPSTPITVDNFPVYHVGITSLGVVFTYPKYSIAAGYEGCPAYVIPLDDLAEYLVPALK